MVFDALAQTDSPTTAEVVPPSFKSDGCSMFPDGDYQRCCVQHDLAYFKGGSIGARRRADNRLFKCVRKTKGWQHRIIAPIMWLGVRVGGVSFLPTPFRWGFGRKMMRAAKSANRAAPLAASEQKK